VGPRAGLDGRKISSPPGLDPGPSSLYSAAISTELPGPAILYINIYMSECVCELKKLSDILRTQKYTKFSIRLTQLKLLKM